MRILIFKTGCLYFRVLVGSLNGPGLFLCSRRSVCASFLSVHCSSFLVQDLSLPLSVSGLLFMHVLLRNTKIRYKFTKFIASSRIVHVMGYLAFGPFSAGWLGDSSLAQAGSQPLYGCFSAAVDSMFAEASCTPVSWWCSHVQRLEFSLRKHFFF